MKCETCGHEMEYEYVNEVEYFPSLNGKSKVWDESEKKWAYNTEIIEDSCVDKAAVRKCLDDFKSFIAENFTEKRLYDRIEIMCFHLRLEKEEITKK